MAERRGAGALDRAPTRARARKRTRRGSSASSSASQAANTTGSSLAPAKSVTIHDVAYRSGCSPAPSRNAARRGAW